MKPQAFTTSDLAFQFMSVAAMPEPGKSRVPSRSPPYPFLEADLSGGEETGKEEKHQHQDYRNCGLFQILSLGEPTKLSPKHRVI